MNPLRHMNLLRQMKTSNIPQGEGFGTETYSSKEDFEVRGKKRTVGGDKNREKKSEKNLELVCHVT